MELRAHPRIQVEMPVSFSLHEIEGRSEGTLYNLSMGGCAVESATTVQAGSHMVLYLHAPGEETPITIELASIQRASRREFGVKFIVVQPQEKKRLEQLIQKRFKQSVSAT
jgi:c-di-GMP-binding flagellar brake protein YcgR